MGYFGKETSARLLLSQNVPPNQGHESVIQAVHIHAVFRSATASLFFMIEDLACSAMLRTSLRVAHRSTLRNPNRPAVELGGCAMTSKCTNQGLSRFIVLFNKLESCFYSRWAHPVSMWCVVLHQSPTDWSVVHEHRHFCYNFIRGWTA